MTEKSKPKQFMTVAESASALSVSTKTIWNWIYARKIESVKLGRSRRISVDALRELTERDVTPVLEAR
jgi:excisionase family DNA binding protein